MSKFKVRDGLNKIVFTGCDLGHLMMDGAKIRSYPLGSNGSIPVYYVPMKDFESETTKQLMMEELL